MDRDPINNMPNFSMPPRRPKDVIDTGDMSSNYAGLMSTTASSRRYLDIEPNTSVRDEYTRDDYYGFRPQEAVDGTTKTVMKKCAKAYDNVGLIKQVIDLMGDFASQGVRIAHTNKNIQRFYRRWWEKVSGAERSERFLNYLYRLGNVVIYKANGKITKKQQGEMSKAAVREIPFRYDFLNPMAVEVVGDYADIFGGGNLEYQIRISAKTREALKKSKKAPSNISPEDFAKIKKGAEFLPLDPDRLHIAHYKKDDWCPWANPMIHAILDDINMMEKMKLADMSALDGAISNIRLWRIGDLENKILPTKAAINKLRDILASNVGGGTMDLVWGPELDFKESNSQVYRFLGNEKYGPVLNAIYGGLGVPQTLTGSSGGGSGFTNNFLSLKTLIEKLEYGRSLLIAFWRGEFEAVAKAMGFPTAAELTFDNMILSDEAAEKNLWIQLSDRYIISDETLRERFGESNPIEESRIAGERKARKKGKIPTKSDPFHNGNTESEFEKLALQNQTLRIDDVTDHEARKPPAPPGGGLNKTPPVGQNGRPKFKGDTSKRKQRRVLPKSKADLADVILWAGEAQKKIATILNPIMLAQYGRKNLRELTTAEQAELEKVKFTTLCGFENFAEISPESLVVAMDKKVPLDPSPFYRNFLDKNKREPSMDELRGIYCLTYACKEF